MLSLKAGISRACLIVLAMIASADSAFAITRQIFDCGDPNGDTTCYLDFLDEGYFFGRSEGEPPRGPNPLGPPYSGSTDVDILYDMTGQYHDYLMVKFGRNGPNGLGGTGNGTTVPNHLYRVAANANGSTAGESTCNVPAGTPAAAATNTTCVVCRGSATLDIVGHEMTHLMFIRELGIGAGATFGEVGSINEGIADVFGESFERYVTGTNDWIAGSGFPSPLRSMANPPSIIGNHPRPDRYLSPDFYTGTEDAGGSHINAGVLGKGTYLASEGGNFNGYTITGIGFDKVEQIWYRALTEYFTADETFNLAYAHIIQAADDLYDEFEVEQVTLALQAVEMNRVRGESVPGDFDNDGDVDGRDFLLWQRGESPNPLSGGDLADWQGNYGAGSFTAAEAASPVPEPAGAILLCLAALDCLMRRRRCG